MSFVKESKEDNSMAEIELLNPDSASKEVDGEKTSLAVSFSPRKPHVPSTPGKVALLMKSLNKNKEDSSSNNQTDTGTQWKRLRTFIHVANIVQVKKKTNLSRDDSFLRKFSTRQQQRFPTIESDESVNVEDEEEQKHTFSSPKPFVVHPNNTFMFYWLGIVTVAVSYNLWTCIAREAFREIQHDYAPFWITLDVTMDIIYIIDIIVQFRTGYLHQGLLVYEGSKLSRKYVHSRKLIFDTICLLPLDLLQFYIGTHPMIRFPRFIKIYRVNRFIRMLESRTVYPNFFRVANLTHTLFLGSHWFAAFYYMISEAEEFVGNWSYPKPEGEFSSVTRKYLASLFWSTLTLTTIGDLAPPETNWEYVFVIISYLIGVFIFATIVGQVGNVITNRNASRQEFERSLDGAKFYMQTHNVPSELQKRVQRWYDYVWTRGRLNCGDINSLRLLPDKLKTELAIHVNLETLRKVTIFQKCEPEFLHDLVLKMHAHIFTPGDLICRQGEVAREMFIIADGVVEIISEKCTVLTQMGPGDFFGEIGILNLDGGINRRTADVRSVGYSELFVLSREDVLSALKDHPDAEKMIREYGQRRLKQIEEHRKKIKLSPIPDHKEIPSNTSSPEKHNKLSLIHRMSPKIKSLPKVFSFDDKNSKSKKGEKPHTVHWDSKVVDNDIDGPNASLLQKVQNNLQKFAQKKNYDIIMKGRRRSSTDVVHPRILVPKEGMKLEHNSLAEESSGPDNSENVGNEPRLPSLFMISKPNSTSQIQNILPSISVQYSPVKTDDSDSETQAIVSVASESLQQELPSCSDHNGKSSKHLQNKLENNIHVDPVHESRTELEENVYANWFSNSMDAQDKDCCHHSLQAPQDASMSASLLMTDVDPERDKVTQYESAISKSSSLGNITQTSARSMGDNPVSSSVIQEEIDKRLLRLEGAYEVNLSRLEKIAKIQEEVILQLQNQIQVFQVSHQQSCSQTSKTDR